MSRAAPRPRRLESPRFPAPGRVWVYFCGTCGAPSIADDRSDVNTTCSFCPAGQAVMYVARYHLALNPQTRKAVR